MLPQIIDMGAFTVVGVDLPLAGENPALILYGWIALAARRTQIGGVSQPHQLYGIWHKAPDATGPHKTSYLVGIGVDGSAPVPAGLTVLAVEAGRWARFEHRGDMGAIGRTYAQVGPWFVGRARADGDNGHRDAPTVEIYDTRQPIDLNHTLSICEPLRW